MANHKATGKKAAKGPELTQRARGLILKVFDILEKEGQPLSTLLAEKAKEEPMRFMDLASKYTVKEVHGEMTHTHEIETLTDDELARRVKTLEGELSSLFTGDEEATEQADTSERSNSVH